MRWRHTPARQLQGQARQVRLEDFRTAIGRQLFVLVLGPQAITHARLQAPGPTGALGGAGPGNTLGVEAGHAAARVETRHPRQPGIDHHAHAVDGQAGLGDVGRQHHFALARRSRFDGRALRRQVQLTVQRTEQDLRALAHGIGQLLMHPADLGLPRQEHQDAAAFIVQRFNNGLHQPRLDELARLERPPPAHIDREHAAFAAQDRRVVQHPGQTLAFQGRRHQEDFQRLLVAEQIAAIEAQGQGQVGVEAALVEFVEDQQADAFQRRIILQATGQDALGDHLDAGIRADLAVEADPVAHSFADLFPQFAGQPFGRRPRRQASWFEHENALSGQPGFVQQGQRHTGGLTGAGRCFEHGLVACRQGFTQGG